MRLTGERLTRCRTGAARTGTSGGGCTTTTARFGYQCPQLRVSAINAASEKLLTRLGVWQDILSRRASCYHGMEVWDKDSFGHISFDDQSMGYNHLGHIVENSVIHYALWNKALQSSDITLLAPAELQQVAWGENETFLTCCYHGMEVWDKDSFGHISFDDQSMGYSHLGHIVENSVIHYALWNKAHQSSDITLLATAELQQVAWGENETFLTLKDGSRLTARLVIGADGANSWLRNKADIPLTFWDYQHHALVATIRTEEPHDAEQSRYSADFLGLSASRAGGDHSHGRTA